MLKRKASLGHNVGLILSVEKSKGRLYGTRQLGTNYTTRRGILKDQPSLSTSAEEAMNLLTEQLEALEQAYEYLSY